MAGVCGQSVDLQDAATIASGAAAPLVSRLRYCDGSQAVYQLSVGARPGIAPPYTICRAEALVRIWVEEAPPRHIRRPGLRASWFSRRRM